MTSRRPSRASRLLNVVGGTAAALVPPLITLGPPLITGGNDPSDTPGHSLSNRSFHDLRGFWITGQDGELRTSYIIGRPGFEAVLDVYAVALDQTPGGRSLRVATRLGGGPAVPDYKIEDVKLVGRYGKTIPSQWSLGSTWNDAEVLLTDPPANGTFTVEVTLKRESEGRTTTEIYASEPVKVTNDAREFMLEAATPEVDRAAALPRRLSDDGVVWSL